MKKIKEILCKIFGHSFNPILFCMFEIEMKAVNVSDLEPEISCLRCGKIFKYSLKDIKR